MSKVGRTLLFAAVLVGTAVETSAQTFTTLVKLDIKDGVAPEASLVQGIDGTLYGTALGGGMNGLMGQGTVFEVTATGAFRVLYGFCLQPNCTDGAYPRASLFLATDGHFYGTTEGGGEGCLYYCGTVFKISSNGVLSTIYSFCTQPNCPDGVQPFGGVIQGSDLNFYGTTNGGGPRQRGGTVYRLTPNGFLRTIHGFCSRQNCIDGEFPWGNLTEGSDGNLYGTTRSGGAADEGEVFRITPAGEFTVLYSFGAIPFDGVLPYAGVVQGNDGNLYGTTVGGGSGGAGTVFQVTPQGDETVIYSFCSQPTCSDGANPMAPLIEGTDGSFYGTTLEGGNSNSECSNVGCGTIFKITPQGSLTTLYRFCAQTACEDGLQPDAGLLQATNGLLYGVTTFGGGKPCPQGCGTVFSLDVGLGPFVTFVRGTAKVNQQFGILGQGFSGTTSVSLNGTPALFTVKSDTFIEATVPAGATTGYVTVTTPSGTLTSNKPFVVIP